MLFVSRNNCPYLKLIPPPVILGWVCGHWGNGMETGSN